MVFVPSARNPVIDFWRGLALAMIFINHIPDNPLTQVTLRRWGFADASEMFVFLAGMTAAMTIGRIYDGKGFLVGTLHCLRRVWRLYRAHVLLVLALVVLVGLAGDYFDTTSARQWFNLQLIFTDATLALTRLMMLKWLPRMADILPLYIVLIAAFPLVWLLRTVRAWLPAAMSCALWLYASGGGFSTGEQNGPASWHFNPLAWQFVFVLGITTWLYREPLLDLCRRKQAQGVAWLIVSVCALAAAPWVLSPAYEAWRVLPPEILRYNNKIDWSLPRVVDFLALACLAVRFNARIAASTALLRQGLCLLGSNALPVYCAGTLLSVVVHLLALYTGQGIVVALLGSIAGLATLCAVALIAERANGLLRPAKAVALPQSEEAETMAIYTATVPVAAEDKAVA